MTAAVTPTPTVLYSVAKPFDVFDTQIRLAGEADIPHDPSRFGSVLSATPSMSATRLCCTKFEAAKAGAPSSAAAKMRPRIEFQLFREFWLLSGRKGLRGGRKRAVFWRNAQADACGSKEV